MASRTGRHRSVGGSVCSSASRYSTRSRARVRCSWAATAPGDEPVSVGQRAGVLARRPRGRRAWPGRPRAGGTAPRRRPPAPRPASSSSSGAARRPQVDHPVLVAPVAVGLLPERGDHVARSDDGVGLEHARLDPVDGGEHPRQGLLDEVVRRGRVRHPGADDPPHHRDQGGDVAVDGGCPAARIGRRRAHFANSTPAVASCEPAGGVFMGDTAAPYPHQEET